MFRVGRRRCAADTAVGAVAATTSHSTTARAGDSRPGLAPARVMANVQCSARASSLTRPEPASLSVRNLSACSAASSRSSPRCPSHRLRTIGYLKEADALTYKRS